MAIALIDSHDHPVAPGFYRSFPYEPVRRNGEIRIDSVHEIRNMTLESLLAGILNHVPLESAFIGVHPRLSNIRSAEHCVISCRQLPCTSTETQLAAETL
jgi:hypothetical protein